MLRDAKEILASATPLQVRWVMARLVSKTDQKAARAVGIHPTTVSRWSNKVELEKAINILLREPVEAALTVLQKAAIDAASVLVSELERKDKLRAADSILDRVGLRGSQKHEIAGKDGSQLTIRVLGNVDLDAI